MLAATVPCMPAMPSISGCDSGIAPMPSSVETTGASRRSARAMTGCIGAGQQHAAPDGQDRPLGALEQRGHAVEVGVKARRGDAASGASASGSSSTVAVPISTSFGMSSRTGPGGLRA